MLCGDAIYSNDWFITPLPRARALHFNFCAVPTDPPQASPPTILNSSSVFVTWQPLPPEHQNGIVTAYVVSVSLGNDTTPQLYNTSSLSLTLVGLLPFSTYTVAVAAETDIGRGPFSASFTIHTPEDGKAY